MKSMLIPKELHIVNVGLRLFYETAIMQKIEAVHVNFQPAPQLDKDIEAILNRMGG